MAPANISFELWAGDDQSVTVADFVQADGTTPYNFAGKHLQYVVADGPDGPIRLTLTDTSGIIATTPGQLTFVFPRASSAAIVGMEYHQVAIVDTGAHELLFVGTCNTHAAAAVSP